MISSVILMRGYQMKQRYNTPHYTIQSIFTNKAVGCETRGETGYSKLSYDRRLGIIVRRQIHILSVGCKNRFHFFQSNYRTDKKKEAYLDSSVKTNFLNLRSLRTIPLVWASCTAQTICLNRCLALGSRSLRLVRT